MASGTLTSLTLEDSVLSSQLARALCGFCSWGRKRVAGGDFAIHGNRYVPFSRISLPYVSQD